MLQFRDRSRVLPARYILVSFVAASQLVAQQPARIVMSPVPILADAVPTDKSGAFLDSKSSQLVIVVPDVAGAAGAMKQMRFDIPNGTNPEVSFAVVPKGDTGITYQYSVTDDQRAPQRSLRMAILLPNYDTSLTFAAAGWTFAANPTSIPDRTGAMNNGTMKMISWTNPMPVNSKVTDVILSLESTYLPGFTDAFVEGQVSAPLTAETIDSLPSDLAGQVRLFLQPGIGSVARLVLAPLFKPGVSKDLIAANYHFGVSALVRSGRVSSSSPYISEMLRTLSNYLQGTGTLVLPSISPNGAMEIQIKQAAALALK